MSEGGKCYHKTKLDKGEQVCGGFRYRRQAVLLNRIIKRNSLENVNFEQKQKKSDIETPWEELSSRSLPVRGNSYANQ